MKVYFSKSYSEAWLDVIQRLILSSTPGSAKTPGGRRHLLGLENTDAIRDVWYTEIDNGGFGQDAGNWNTLILRGFWGLDRTYEELKQRLRHNALVHGIAVWIVPMRN